MIDFRWREVSEDENPKRQAVKQADDLWRVLQVRFVLPGPHLVGDPENYKWSDWKDVPIDGEVG